MLSGGLRVLGAPTCIMVLRSASEYSNSSVCNGEGMLWWVNQGNHALPESHQTSKAILPLPFTALDVTESRVSEA